MKMNRIVLLIGAVLVGCMCSNARAGFNEEPARWPAIPYQSVDQFDVGREISELKQAKAERDNAIKNSHSDVKTIDEARQKYENIKKQTLEKLKNRRRDLYMNGFDVTRHGYVWGDYWDPQCYGIDCPFPSDWVIIPDSCRYEVNRKEGNIYINDNRTKVTDNGYFVFIPMAGPCKKEGYIDFTLIARYRYNDAIIENLLNIDMVVLQALIEDVL